MVGMWSFETIKVFPDVPYEDLFRRFSEAVVSFGLEITRLDESSGVIEARKPGRWLMKSGHEILVTVRTNAKVTVVERVSMKSSIFSGKASTDDMLTAKLIATVKAMT